MENDDWIQYADEDPRPPPPKWTHDIQLPRSKLPNEPDRYRVSPSAARRKCCLSTEVMKFRFGTRIVSASGSSAHSDYPHVRHLRIQSSAVQRFIQLLSDFLPYSTGSWIRSVFPEWFLPADIVLKTEKPEHQERFDMEVKAYAKLKPLQGAIVPRCYGLSHYNGLRSVLLQDIGGISLEEPAGLTLSLEALSGLLQDCHRALHAYGVHQEDPQLPNFRLVDNRLMALDFEMVAFDHPKERNALFMKTNIEHMARNYRDRQRMEWREGNLVPA